MVRRRIGPNQREIGWAEPYPQNGVIKEYYIAVYTDRLVFNKTVSILPFNVGLFDCCNCGDWGNRCNHNNLWPPLATAGDHW